MAVASVKSLIRYFGDLGVVFHGDPSLDYDDSNFLREQIPGCRYVSFSDAERSIKKDPNIYRRRKELPDRFKLASGDRKSTRLNSSHVRISYAVFCLKKKKKTKTTAKS